VSKRRRRSQKRSFSQTVILILSGLIAFSMVISLIIVALPGPQVATPTSLPTWTPLPTWTALPSPTVQPSPTPETLPLPTQEPTEPAIGPEPATATPTTTPTATATPSPTITPTTTNTPSPTITPTATNAPSSDSSTLTFAVAGDSRDGPEIYRRVLAAVMGDGSEFLLHTGDLVNKGTEAQWQEFALIMEGFALPFYPVAGNHDGLNGQLDGYLATSGAPATHYSFDEGDVHFVMADSHNGGISAGELAWLREDLSASMLPVKMVLLHHPPFDPDGTDHIMAYGNEGFMALMVEQEVDYVFAGHIHAYAREERDGVTYVITGGAGAPLYSSAHPLAFHHYLRVTVQDRDVTVEVVEV
jgi:predicted phosphodiesterase